MPSCCLLPRLPAKPPFCFPLLPLLQLPALCVLHSPLFVEDIQANAKGYEMLYQYALDGR